MVLLCPAHYWRSECRLVDRCLAVDDLPMRAGAEGVGAYGWWEVFLAVGVVFGDRVTKHAY